MKHTRLSKHAMAATALAIIAGTAGLAQAQPNPNDPGLAANPPNWPQGNNNGPNFRNMTPEQRQQALLAMEGDRVRTELAGYGITDKGVQDAVVAFAQAQSAARQGGPGKLQMIEAGLPVNVGTDEELALLLRDLRGKTAEEKARQDAAVKDLDAKIHFSTTPRLDAALTVLGLVGDEASYAGVNGGAGGGFGGGFGGPGGGFGGGRGGGGFGGAGGPGGAAGGAGGGFGAGGGGRRGGRRGGGGNGGFNGGAGGGAGA